MRTSVYQAEQELENKTHQGSCCQRKAGLLSWWLLLVLGKRRSQERGDLSARHLLGKGLPPALWQLLCSIWINAHTLTQSNPPPPSLTPYSKHSVYRLSPGPCHPVQSAGPQFTKSGRRPLGKWLFYRGQRKTMHLSKATPSGFWILKAALYQCFTQSINNF